MSLRTPKDVRTEARLQLALNDRGPIPTKQMSKFTQLCQQLADEHGVVMESEVRF